MNNNIDVTVEKIVLDKIRFQLYNSFSKSIIQDMKLKEVVSHISNNFTYQLSGFLLGKKEVASVSYYSDWWQELRTKLLPKWYLKKYPSTKEKVVFDVIYPTLNIAVGETHEPVISFYTTKVK